MESTDYEFESSAKVSQRGTSAVIELDIAYTDRRKPSNWSQRSRQSRVSRVSMMPAEGLMRSSKEELEELGETLEHLTSEFGKQFGIAVDEDGCPDKPPEMKCFRNPYLKSLFEANRQAIRPAPYRYVILNFRIMRRNASMYVGYLLSQKGVSKKDLYTANYLPMWTHCLRVKMRANVKVGVIFHGMKARLGLNNATGLIFCLDGFFGLDAYGDAFGNVGTGMCPWMELSGNGSPKSLRLKDADNIYVSVATESMRQLVHQRKMRINRPAHSALANAVTFDDSDKRNRSKSGGAKHEVKFGEASAGNGEA